VQHAVRDAQIADFIDSRGICTLAEIGEALYYHLRFYHRNTKARVHKPRAWARHAVHHAQQSTQRFDLIYRHLPREGRRPVLCAVSRKERVALPATTTTTLPPPAEDHTPPNGPRLRPEDDTSADDQTQTVVFRLEPEAIALFHRGIVALETMAAYARERTSTPGMKL
jgi:hypothetical protein